jgi:hypothetical protein
MDFTDTDPKIQKILLDGYRKMSPQQKMLRVSELTKSIQQLALSRIQKQYPNSSEREQRLRLASLWLDKQTMIDAFGWDPQAEGY